MSRGKHSASKDEFDDFRSNYNNDEIERTSKYPNFKEDPENMDSFMKSYVNTEEPSNVKVDDDDEYYDDFDDEYDLSKIYKILGIAAVVIIVAVIAIVIGVKGGKKSNKNETNTTTNTVATEKKEEMIKTLDGFNVLGKIEIKKLNIEQYILDSVDENALKKGVGHLYGDKLNAFGNFVIVGHNYEKVFKDINTLQSGDEIEVTDSSMTKKTYVVSSISECEPDDLNALKQDVSKTELTLITCKDGATKRIVIKAIKK